MHSKTMVAVKYLLQPLSPLVDCQLKWLGVMARLSFVCRIITKQSFEWAWTKICAQWKHLFFLPCIPVCYLVFALLLCCHNHNHIIAWMHCSWQWLGSPLCTEPSHKSLLDGCVQPHHPCLYCGICSIIVLLQSWSYCFMSVLQLGHPLDFVMWMGCCLQ